MAKPITMIEDYAGVTVVTIQDSAMLDAARIDQLGKELFQLVDEQNKQKIVLDFSNVRFLSSQALGILLTLNKKCKAIKGSLALCGFRDELMKIFTITRVDKLFEFHATDAAALSAFGVRVE